MKKVAEIKIEVFEGEDKTISVGVGKTGNSELLLWGLAAAVNKVHEDNNLAVGPFVLLCAKERAERTLKWEIDYGQAEE